MGQSPVNSPTFDITSSDPYLVLGALVSDNAYWWGEGNQVTLVLDITATEDAPLGHTALLGIIIGTGETDYEHVFPVPITLGLLIEDFESMSFNSFDWTHNGAAEWAIESDAYSGSYSAKSGSINHSETSELSVEMNVLYDGELTFWAKASSEVGGTGTVYDYLEFYLNDTAQDLMIGGVTDWVEYTVSIPTGEHTLRWVYQKDGAQSSGEDCAWIDFIVFPSGSAPPLNIHFGDLNLDGVVSIFDVILSVNYLMGHFEFSIEQSQNADMNLDGFVNIYDVLLLVDAVLAE